MFFTLEQVEEGKIICRAIAGAEGQTDGFCRCIGTKCAHIRFLRVEDSSPVEVNDVTREDLGAEADELRRQRSLHRVTGGGPRVQGGEQARVLARIRQQAEEELDRWDPTPPRGGWGLLEKFYDDENIRLVARFTRARDLAQRVVYCGLGGSPLPLARSGDQSRDKLVIPGPALDRVDDVHADLLE